MADLVNVFSWSMSRAQKFGTCPRAYYFHYYGSWGGWERGAPARVRELWLLKKLTNRRAWAGTAVHEAIAAALGLVAKGGPLPSRDEAVSTMRARMRKEFLESRSKAWRFSRAIGMVEHAYDEPVDDDEWRENYEHARRCLETFFDLPLLQEILEVGPGGWLPIDSLATFSLDGFKVYVAPDFAFRDRDGRLRIIDWKTGRPRESDKEQVTGYVLFAMDQWGAAVESTLGEVQYLATGEGVQVDVSASSLDAFRERALDSIRRMRKLLTDPENNSAEEEAFVPASNPDTCNNCNFRATCDASVA